MTDPHDRDLDVSPAQRTVDGIAGAASAVGTGVKDLFNWTARNHGTGLSIGIFLVGGYLGYTIFKPLMDRFFSAIGMDGKVGALCSFLLMGLIAFGGSHYLAERQLDHSKNLRAAARDEQRERDREQNRQYFNRLGNQTASAQPPGAAGPRAGQEGGAPPPAAGGGTWEPVPRDTQPPAGGSGGQTPAPVFTPVPAVT